MAKVLPFVRCILRRFSGATSHVRQDQSASSRVETCMVCSICGDDVDFESYENGDTKSTPLSVGCKSCQSNTMSPSCSVCRERVFPESELLPSACSSCGSFVHMRCDPDAELAFDDFSDGIVVDQYVCKACKTVRSDFVISESKEGEDAESIVETPGHSWSTPSPSSRGDDLVFMESPSDDSRVQTRKEPSKKTKFGPPVKKDKRSAPEIRGIFGKPGISLEGPSRLDFVEDRKAKIMMVCSAKDRAAISYDLCVLCGSMGQGQEGRLLPCVQCGQAYHPYCLDVKLTQAMLNNGWRCPSCTLCESCGGKDGLEDMVFCEDCSVSVHKECMKLQSCDLSDILPWRCRACATCAKCGKPEPGESTQPGRWGKSFQCSLCSSAIKCRVCDQEYVEGDLLIRCSECEKWLHGQCDQVQNEEEANVCLRLGYACLRCRPVAEQPPHLKTTSTQAKEESGASQLPLPVVRFRRDLHGNISDFTSSSSMINPSGSRNIVDGVCLSDIGAKTIKELMKTHSDFGRIKRNFRKRNGGDADAASKELRSTETPLDGVPVKRGMSEAALLRKQKAIQRCGIGGFSVKIVKTRIPSRSEPSKESKKPRKRKAKSKILEYIPPMIQDAFFGKHLLTAGRISPVCDENPLPEDNLLWTASADAVLPLSQDELHLIFSMQQNRVNRKRDEKEHKMNGQRKRRVCRVQRLKAGEKRRKVQKESEVDIVEPVESKSDADDPEEEEEPTDAWQDVLLNPDIFNDVMVDSLLEAEIEDGHLGFDEDLPIEKDETCGKLDESGLGSSSVADSGISESGPDSTPHTTHAKDDLADFLLHESFDETDFPAMDAKDLETVFSVAAGHQESESVGTGDQECCLVNDEHVMPLPQTIGPVIQQVYDPVQMPVLASVPSSDAQIGKAWRALSCEERQDFVKRARDNRAALKLSKPASSSTPTAPVSMPCWTPASQPALQSMPQTVPQMSYMASQDYGEYDQTLDIMMSKQKQLRDFLQNQQMEQYGQDWCSGMQKDLLEQEKKEQCRFAPQPSPQQQQGVVNHQQSFTDVPVAATRENLANKLDLLWTEGGYRASDVGWGWNGGPCHYYPRPPTYYPSYPAPYSYRSRFKPPYYNEVPYGQETVDATSGRGNSAKEVVTPPAPPTPCAVSPMPPPSPPPKVVSSEEDRRKQFQYEQWLTQNARILSMRQTHYQTEVERFRKVRRTLLTRQRQLRKTSMELNPQDSATLEKISTEQSDIQRQLEQCRKMMKQHSGLMNDYSAKYGPLAPPPPVQEQASPVSRNAPVGPVECYQTDQRYQHAITPGYMAASPMQSPMTPSPGSYHHPYPSPQQASVPPMVSPGIPYLNDDSAASISGYQPQGQTCVPPHSSPGFQGMHHHGGNVVGGVGVGQGYGYAVHHSSSQMNCRVPGQGNMMIQNQSAQYQQMPSSNGAYSISMDHHAMQYQQRPVPQQMYSYDQLTSPEHQQEQHHNAYHNPGQTSCAAQYHQTTDAGHVQPPTPSSATPTPSSSSHGGGNPNHPFLPLSSEGKCKLGLRGGNPLTGSQAPKPFMFPWLNFGGRFKLGLRGGNPFSPGVLPCVPSSASAASTTSSSPSTSMPADSSESVAASLGAVFEEEDDASREDASYQGGMEENPDSMSQAPDSCSVSAVESEDQTVHSTECEMMEEFGSNPVEEIVDDYSSDPVEEIVDEYLTHPVEEVVESDPQPEEPDISLPDIPAANAPDVLNVIDDHFEQVAEESIVASLEDDITEAQESSPNAGSSLPIEKASASEAVQEEDYHLQEAYEFELAEEEETGSYPEEKSHADASSQKIQHENQKTADQGCRMELDGFEIHAPTVHEAAMLSDEANAEIFSSSFSSMKQTSYNALVESRERPIGNMLFDVLQRPMNEQKRSEDSPNLPQLMKALTGKREVKKDRRQSGSQLAAMLEGVGEGKSEMDSFGGLMKPPAIISANEQQASVSAVSAAVSNSAPLSTPLVTSVAPLPVKSPDFQNVLLKQLLQSTSPTPAASGDPASSVAGAVVSTSVAGTGGGVAKTFLVPQVVTQTASVTATAAQSGPSVASAITSSTGPSTSSVACAALSSQLSPIAFQVPRVMSSAGSTAHKLLGQQFHPVPSSVDTTSVTASINQPIVSTGAPPEKPPSSEHPQLDFPVELPETLAAIKVETHLLPVTTMSEQAALLEAERILKMAGIKEADPIIKVEPESSSCSVGSRSSVPVSPVPGSWLGVDTPKPTLNTDAVKVEFGTTSLMDDIVNGSEAGSLKPSPDEMRGNPLTEAELKKQKDLEARRAKRRLYQKKRRMMENERKAALKAAAENGTVSPQIPLTSPSSDSGSRPGPQKGVKRAANSSNGMMNHAAPVAVPPGFIGGRATPVTTGAPNVAVGTISPSGAPAKKKSRKQSAKVEEVDYEGFIDSLMQKLRSMPPPSLGEPPIPADVSEPALPPVEEPKVQEPSKKSGQMLSNRGERFDWLSTSGRLIGEFGNAVHPAKGDYYNLRGSYEKEMMKDAHVEGGLKYYSLEFGPKDYHHDGSLKLEVLLKTRLASLENARSTPQIIAKNNSGMFSPTSGLTSRQRNPDSPESYISSSSPECILEDEPIKFYSGLWNSSDESEQDEEPKEGAEENSGMAPARKRRRRRFATDGGSPVVQIVTPIPLRPDDADFPVSMTPPRTLSPDDKENLKMGDGKMTVVALTGPTATTPTTGTAMSPQLPLREANIAVTLTLSGDRIKDVAAVIGKLSSILGIPTPATFEIDEVMDDNSLSNRVTSGASTPMELGDSGKDVSDSISLSSLMKQASSCSSASSGSLDNDRYCKHCDVLIGIGTNEVRKSAKDFGLNCGTDEEMREEFVFCSTNCYMQFALIKRVPGNLTEKGLELKMEPKDDDDEDLKREIEVLGLGGVGKPKIKMEACEKPDTDIFHSTLLSTVRQGIYMPEDMDIDDMPESPPLAPSIRLRVGPNCVRSFLVGMPATVPKELRDRLEWLKDPRPTPSPESAVEEEESSSSSEDESSEEESSEEETTVGRGSKGDGKGKGDKRVGSAATGGIESEEETGRLSTPRDKNWKGIAYKYFDFEEVPVSKKNRPPTENELTDMLFRMGICLMPTWDSLDQRECAFCGVPGDGSSDGPARLLNLDVDKWVHLNCALWTDEVYETTSGALMNVDQKLKQNAAFTCSLCERPGASVHCFKLRCTNYYHLGCASKAGCVFYKNKTVFCQQHVPRSEKENELTTLCVFRRVYVDRDEERQIASMMHMNDSDNYLLRVGSLIFMEIGQLLPQQLNNPLYHTKEVIYPVGYKAVRIYWSYRRLNKRCCYECTITEEEGRPQFSVRCRERDLDDVTFLGRSPKEAWSHVLEPIARMRLEAGIIKMFPKFLTGDDLFGLTEPAVVKIIESLPGLDALADYRFKYGRNPMFEMPLAINPSGCARAEPRGRTISKRVHAQRGGCVARSTTTMASAASPSSASSSSLMASLHNYDIYGLYGKQPVHSKSSQYKKMKQEWRNNVYLARSKIQGLGLYAARDIERNTMIIEYIGELIRPQISELREKRYEAANRGTYMFRLDDDRVIDATLKGGLARYINHCCNPNCVAEAVEVDRDVKIIIFSKIRISKGEELSYDYRFDVEDEQHKIPCMCGASNCKKWMN
ncbi:unnamed protein product [Notodromas monacha]|uniref:[Histone H3]-lysine(4) N-trimethyltransferase n=1 Tax=Notodromas monacha TaxID=399045 RepID=A0A7R9BFT4_9CRUS|nr:unnamed protein product [Notodromas monacha]CAG0914651.1 unnamed protein product [Notodromas monacha]